VFGFSKYIVFIMYLDITYIEVHSKSYMRKSRTLPYMEHDSGSADKRAAHDSKAGDALREMEK